MTPKQQHKRATQEHLARPRFALGVELGERHINLSSCTGKGCSIASDCSRVRRRGNTIYTGPLLHMMDAECVDSSMFVELAKSIYDQGREAA